MSAQVLVWQDVETTGLDELNDSLLEVAVIITDTDLNVLDEAGFHATVQYPKSNVERMRAAAPAVVQDMHDATGLWDRLPTGRPTKSIDADLTQYLRNFAPDQSAKRPGDRVMRLAGNSVKLDYAFTRVDLPRVFDQLSFRVVDVSTLAFLADEWHGCGYFPKARNHSAMADIRESLEEARWARSVIRQPENWANPFH